MNDQRTPRDSQAREKTERASDTWVPPSVLPEPNPQEGYVFKWVRTSSLGHADNTNVSQKFRAGWTPVKTEDHPEMHVMSDIHSQFRGNIEIGGLLLCKMPAKEVEARRQYYARTAQQQMDSVDNSYLKENDPRMPMLAPDRKSRTDFRRE